VVLLVEEMGRACLPGPYVESAVVATSLLLAAAPGPQPARLLPALAAGERIATLALLEESATFEPGGPGMAGTAGGVLDGLKLFVKDAHVAHDLLVAVRDGPGVSLFVVSRDRPGLSLEPMETMSGQPLFAVRFAGVPVSAGDLLGPPGGGREVLDSGLRLGALARAAEMVGAAQRILELAVDHARVRVQSGRPIGAFQAIQHHCADLLRDVEGARWAVRHAAWRLQEGRDARADVAIAKAHAGEACLAVARRGHQVLGAIGYCEEHPLHLLHKRILAASLDFGDARAHLETVARAIGLA
jgi:alkylation response protein AidB-like acyl-CoA dehydrogenase